MGVGQEGVGKTTLCRRLLRKDFDNVESTVGIDTFIYCGAMADELDTDGNVIIRDITGKYQDLAHSANKRQQKHTTT